MMRTHFDVFTQSHVRKRALAVVIVADVVCTCACRSMYACVQFMHFREHCVCTEPAIAIESRYLILGSGNGTACAFIYLQLFTQPVVHPLLCYTSCVDSRA